jgi:hypothetical protein
MKLGLKIDVPTMARVKSQTGYHLGHVLNDDCKMLKEITEDPLTFCGVLHAMVGKGSFEEFAAGMDGDSLEAAAQEFIGAIRDFCPSRTRPLFTALMNKGQEVMELMGQKMGDAITKVEAINAASILNSISTPNVSDAPALSESPLAN